MKVAYLLQQGDRTAFSASTPTVAIALTEEIAKQWEASLPKSSWDYRRYVQMPLIEAIEPKETV